MNQKEKKELLKKSVIKELEKDIKLVKNDLKLVQNEVIILEKNATRKNIKNKKRK